MKIERTKNTIDGFLWGATSKVVNTVLPFVLRTVVIYKLGVEYLGLSSLFASILQVLSLSELGFAHACVFAMYKPIAEDNYDTVGSILQYLKKIYSVIGTVLLGIGFALLPFINQIIKGEVPADVNVYVLFLIYLSNSALSYYFFAYKSSLLMALQRNATINKVGLFTNTILRLGQLIVLFVIPNYYLYVILIPITTLANNVIKAKIVDKKYACYLNPIEISPLLKTEIKSRIAPLIGIKISSVLINAADTLVISAFLGLRETALYNNYFFVMTSVQSIIMEIHSSMFAGVGNSLVVDSKEETIRKFEMLNFLNTWLIIFCTSCFVCMFQPFMKVWVGTEKMMSEGMMLLFCVYFYATSIIRMIVVYKDAAGVWREDMIRCYCSCALNILLNLASVRFIGLYGVIGSSVFVSLAIDPWMAKTVYKKIFKTSPKDFYLNLIKDSGICVVVCFILNQVCKNIVYSWVGIIIRAVICCLGVNGLLFLIYFKDSRYDIAKTWVCIFLRRLVTKVRKM